MFYIRKIVRNIIIMMILFSIALPFCSAVDDVEIEIDYPKHTTPTYEAIPISDSILSFINTTGDINDIDVNLDQQYSSLLGNYTMVIVYTNNISADVDYTFVNNTKSYEYIVQNSTDSANLTIYIDYSSIEVPVNPYEVEIQNLTERIDNLTVQIDDLNITIANLTANNTELNTTLTEKLALIEQLETEKAALVTERDALISDKAQLVAEKNVLQSENDELEGNVETLEGEVENKTTIIDIQDAQIVKLRTDVSKRDSTIEQATGIFSLGYEDANGNGHMNINLAWFAIGCFFAAGAIFIYMTRQDEFSKSGKTINSIGKKFHIPLISKGENLSKKEWDMIEEQDDFPDIEKEHLKKNFDEEEEDEEPEPVEFVEPESEKQPGKKETKSVSEPPKNKTSKRKKSPKKRSAEYWNSPKGRAHKERLRKLAQGE